LKCFVTRRNDAVVAVLSATAPATRQLHRRNLEFSYIATSNHYLSDVWDCSGWDCASGTSRRGAWRDFGLREMLREMDKQVLADGATSKRRPAITASSPSFSFTRSALPANDVEIEERYWSSFTDAAYIPRLPAAGRICAVDW
jgi:hypothetical protein